jgi:hypothetical protein
MFASIGRAKASQLILPALIEISMDVQLKLPSDRISLSKQVYRLNDAYQRLTSIEEEVLAYYATTYRPSTRHLYRKLLKVTRQMMQAVDTFRHLAAEFPVDPEGTVACLESMLTKMPWPRNLKILERSLKSYKTSQIA